MKLQFAIVMGIILVGSIATVNLAFLVEDSASANTMKSTAGILGHVTLTATDSEGNVIAYRQTDNVIVDSGDECIAEGLFAQDFSCSTPNTSYTEVSIGTSSQPTHVATGTNLNAYHATTGVTFGAVTTGNANSGSFVTLTAGFDSVGATIGEAALRNNVLSAAGDTLALQSFDNIVLGASDALTIDWTINVNGG